MEREAVRGVGDTGTDGTGGEGRGRAPERVRLISGPGVLLLWLYGVMVVGALSRSVYQLTTAYEEAPLPYVLSAVAGVVYCFITYTLVRGGERARRAAQWGCALELLGVLVVGTLTLVDSSAFADATVWSYYGRDYLFIPVILPVTALMWLRGSRRRALGAA